MLLIKSCHFTSKNLGLQLNQFLADFEEFGGEEKDLSRLFWILLQLRYIYLLVYEGNLKYVRNLMGVYMFIITGTIFLFTKQEREGKSVCACTCMDFHGVMHGLPRCV